MTEDSRLGELPREEALPPPQVALWSEEELVNRTREATGDRYAAVWACGRYLQTYGSVPQLADILRLLDDAAPPARVFVLLEELEKAERDPAIGAAIACRVDNLARSGEFALNGALELVVSHGAPDQFEVCRRYVSHSNGMARTSAVRGIVESGHPEAVPTLLHVLATSDEPLTVFSALRGLLVLDDIEAARSAGRLLVGRLTDGSLENSDALTETLDPFDAGWYFFESAAESLYPGRFELERGALEEYRGAFLVPEGDPLARHRARAVVSSSARQRMCRLADEGQHVALTRFLLRRLREAVDLVEKQAPLFAGRARTLLAFLECCEESEHFDELDDETHLDFALWGAIALALVLRGRDPQRELERAKEDPRVAESLLRTDAILPVRAVVSLARMLPKERLEEIYADPDAMRSPAVCFALAARFPETILKELMEDRQEGTLDFFHDLCIAVPKVAGDRALPVLAKGLKEGQIFPEEFLTALRTLGTRRSQEYLKWSWSLLEEEDIDAEEILDAVLASGGSELWEQALHGLRRGHFMPLPEDMHEYFVAKVATLLELLEIEDDPGDAVVLMAAAYRERHPGDEEFGNDLDGDDGLETHRAYGDGYPKRADYGKRQEHGEPGEYGDFAGSLRSDHDGPRPAKPREDLGANETIRRSERKIGRNDPCPCGSGKKYKRCCGRGRAPAPDV